MGEVLRWKDNPKEYQKAAYRRRKAVDPDLNKKEWQRRKAKLIVEGKYEEYIKKISSPATKKHYARNRYRILQLDNKKRVALVNYLGGQCIKCGYDKDVRALALDHRHGDGYLDRQRLGSKIQRYYIKNLAEASENLQVLCYNCNAIKVMENGEHNRSRRIKE